MFRSRCDLRMDRLPRVDGEVEWESIRKHGREMVSGSESFHKLLLVNWERRM